MKKILLIALLLIVGCEKPQREMIVEKWDNGTPKKVNYVVGEGAKQEIVGRITYYENGEFEIKGEYEKGKKHGKHEYYDENGQIIKVETYKDGKLDGQFTGWYESGQKRIEGSYKDGKHTDIWTSWDSSGVETSASDWFQKAFDAHNNKKYDEAISFYLRSIELNHPDVGIVYYNMGIAYKAQGNYTKAIQSYKKTIDIKPDYVSAYINMGFVYEDQGNLTKAIESFEKVIELKPDDADSYINMGYTYKNQGNLTKAIESFEKVIELKPDDADSYNRVGLVYNIQGNYTKAIENFKKAIGLDPNDALAYGALGIAYSDTGNYTKAIELYEKAIELDSDLGRKLYNSIGYAYELQGNYTKAIQSYEKAIELDPDNAYAYDNMGNAYYDLGKRSRAEKYYKKAIKLNPGLPEDLFNQARTKHNQGKSVQAIRLHKEAARLGHKGAQDWLKKNGHDWYNNDDTHLSLIIDKMLPEADNCQNNNFIGVQKIKFEDEQNLIPYDSPYPMGFWLELIGNLVNSGAAYIILNSEVCNIKRWYYEDILKQYPNVYQTVKISSTSYSTDFCPDKIGDIGEYPLALIIDTEDVDLRDPLKDIDWMIQFLPGQIPEWIEAIEDLGERQEMMELMGVGGEFDVTKSPFYKQVVLIGF